MDTHWYIIEFEYLLNEIKNIKENIEYSDIDTLNKVYARLTELVERYNKPVEHKVPKPGKLKKIKK